MGRRKPRDRTGQQLARRSNLAAADGIAATDGTDHTDENLFYSVYSAPSVARSVAALRASARKTLNDRRDVQRRRVQHRQPGDVVIAQQQRQFRAAENHRVDVLAIAQRGNQLDELLA